MGGTEQKTPPITLKPRSDLTLVVIVPACLAAGRLDPTAVSLGAKHVNSIGTCD
jgi:hypothetical protein